MRAIRSVAVLAAVVLGFVPGAGPVSARADAPDWFTPLPEPYGTRRLSLDASREGDFELGPGFALIRDEHLDAPVWEHAGGGNGWIAGRDTLPAAYELTARVRMLEHVDIARRAVGWLHRPATSATLCAGADDGEGREASGWRLTLIPWRNDQGATFLRAQGLRPSRPDYLEAGSSRVTSLQHLTDRPANTHAINFGARFTEAPSPLTAEAYRREIEAALAAGVARGEITERWHPLRIERRPGRVRMFVNGVPVGEDPLPVASGGRALLRLAGPVRVASLTMRPLDDKAAPWYPVDLTDRLNGQAVSGDGPAALAADALPAPGAGTVAGIPFLFSRDPWRNDHVDLGHSFFRQRNLFRHAGSVTRQLWPDPVRAFDPGRITFNVPNRTYIRLWLLAAFDENPLATPVVTARFFKPDRGFPVDAAVAVPGLTARSTPGAARRLPVRRPDGSEGALWLVPIDLDAARLAAEMRQMGGVTTLTDMDTLSLELTREVHPFRAYPDPHNYGSFQGGAPSGVRIFAMTLEEAPLHMVAGGNRHGNVYVAPEHPLWQVDLVNQRSAPVSGRVRLTVTDPYDAAVAAVTTPFALPANGGTRLEIPLNPALFGLHTVLTEVDLDPADEAPWGVPPLRRKGTFAQLPPDTRQATLENSPWSVGGPFTHGRHDHLEDVLYLLRAIGARGQADRRRLDADTARRWGIRPNASWMRPNAPPPWAFEDPYDPEAWANDRERVGRAAALIMEEHPMTPAIAGVATERSITRELTSRVPRRYLGEDPAWSEEEARAVRGHLVYGQATLGGIREHAPEANIALGWNGSLYAIPLLEAGFPRELFDYIGVDDPVFVRTPEMPMREVTFHRLWALRQAMLEHGYDDVPIIHVESYFPNSNPLGLGWRRSADHYVRLNLLARAIMPQTLFAGVFGLQDTSSYWGSQHYGEHGLLTRQPEANPKPALVAYATMTRLLDPGTFQGWLPTGSHSSYCLHFTSGGRHVYPMWSLRGRREAWLTLPEGAEAVLVDEQGNAFELERDGEGRVGVSLTPTPLWVVSDEPVRAVTLGLTDHAYVASAHPLEHAQFADGSGRRYRPENKVEPGSHAILLDPLETPWRYLPGPYPAYAENHWGAPRYPGPMRSEAMRCGARDATVWEITLEEPDARRELAAWYGVFEPQAPLPIPGKARALGVWADGRSNWGRIVYEIEDADGEIWRSIGTRNEHNCDDIHSWSYFNFDGWRWLEFPLPGHLPYDDFREKDTVWWGSENNGAVVRLPLKLRRIIIEQRTHNIYVDTLVEETDRSVRLHRLTAVYDGAAMMRETPAEAQRALAGLLRWDTGGAPLPNPIAELAKSGVGPPTAFAVMAPPEFGQVTRLEVTLAAVEAAAEYRIYVSAYEDGRGAVRVASGPEPRLELTRLPVGTALYLFATSVDAEGRESEPSEAERILLIDEFEFR